MIPIPESDWKKFTPLKQRALERFCDAVLKEAATITADEARTKQERYLALYDLMKDRDKELAQMFDRHARSQAMVQLFQIAARGLMTEDELRQFTEDTQQAVRQSGSFRA